MTNPLRSTLSKVSLKKQRSSTRNFAYITVGYIRSSRRKKNSAAFKQMMSRNSKKQKGSSTATTLTSRTNYTSTKTYYFKYKAPKHNS